MVSVGSETLDFSRYVSMFLVSASSIIVTSDRCADRCIKTMTNNFVCTSHWAVGLNVNARVYLPRY